MAAAPQSEPRVSAAARGDTIGEIALRRALSARRAAASSCYGGRMRPLVTALLLALAPALACGPVAAPIVASPEPPVDVADAKQAIGRVLDDFHDAAARADEARYFDHFTPDGVFLGTDGTERWDVAAFRVYAHPYFKKGKAWTFRAAKRDVTLGADGLTAWFDEALETKNLGPARGSGVLVRDPAGRWRVAQYNLSVPIPNDRFDEVRDLIAGKRPGGDPPRAAGGVIRGFVNFTGKAPVMKIASRRKDTEYCKKFMVPHNAVIVNGGKLADTLVRIEVGAVKGNFKAPPVPVRMAASGCTLQPRLLGVLAGQEVEINNGDATLHSVHAWRGSESWFNEAQPMGAPPIVRSVDEAGIYRLTSDVFPWMRSFIVATDHPFFAVSEADGSFQIPKVPAGKYTLEAWHSIYGVKKATVEVIADQTVELSFSYDGKEPEPPENQGELKAL